MPRHTRTCIDRTYRYRCEGNKIWDSLTPEEKKKRAKHLKKLQAAEQAMTPTVPKDTSYKRIQYVRYADDFLIGVIGSKEDAESIKQKVKNFLMDSAETGNVRRQKQKSRIRETGRDF